MHAEDDFSSGKTLEFNNCNIISDWNAAFGVGLRPNLTLIFKNCDFYGNYHQTWVSSLNQQDHIGAVFFHDSATSLKGINQKIIFDNCRIRSIGDHALVPYALNYEENEVEVTFINNMLWSEINGKGNGVIWHRTSPDGVAWSGNNMFLTGDSFGNNVTELNK
ncbi:TPA: hypothetical protein VBX77_001397 [Yersinia enterocolitica]|nr:hypothetical protein [Yersinia enterocolitica]